MKDLNKYFNSVWIVALLGLYAIVISFYASNKIQHLERQLEKCANAPADTVTVIRTDTLLIAEPKIEYRYIKYSDTVTICHELRDTVKELVFLPREYVVYKDTSYRAVVSGVQPRLDSLTVYPKTEVLMITKTIKVPDKKRWGAGVQVGAGWNGKEVLPYVGVGVQYNLVRW